MTSSTLIGEGPTFSISNICLDNRTMTFNSDLTFEGKSAGTFKYETTWMNFCAAKDRVEERRKKVEQDRIDAEREKARLAKETADRAERERLEAE